MWVSGGLKLRWIVLVQSELRGSWDWCQEKVGAPRAAAGRLAGEERAPRDEAVKDTGRDKPDLLGSGGGGAPPRETPEDLESLQLLHLPPPLRPLRSSSLFTPVPA